MHTISLLPTSSIIIWSLLAICPHSPCPFSKTKFSSSFT
jgi:hypothetical protein